MLDRWEAGWKFMGLRRQRWCDDIYRPNMKLCRYIATLTLRLPLCLPAGLQAEREPRPGLAV